MAQRRILHIINSHDIGGAETMLLSLLEGLDREKYNVMVCVIGDSPLTGKLNERGYETRQLPIYRNKYDLRFLMRLLRTVRQLSPDIIQSHIWFTNYYASLCGRILGMPVIATFHSIHLVETVPEKLVMKLIYANSRKVVMVSRYQLEHFKFPDNPAKVTIIRNGVQIPLETKDRSSGIPHQAPGTGVIITVGNLRPVKGHSHLLRAVHCLVSTGEKITLHIVGDGELKDDLVRETQELNIAGNVHFCGFRKDVIDLLSGADVFVCSSESEANSIAIMEAMSMAKPVVATCVGGNPELLEDGHDGFLVPAGNPEAMASKILFILKNKEAAARMGNNARSKIIKDYSMRHMVQNYEKLYEHLLNHRYAF